MKRNASKIGLILLVLILIFSCVFFTSCSKKKSVVTFSVDGTEYETIETAGKESLTMPASPAKEGYTFDGWYEDNGVWSKPFDADSLKNVRLKNNMTVYAKWNPIGDQGEKYTINYVGGENATGTAPQVQNLPTGSQITLPENSFIKEGFTFSGWSDGSNTHAAASTYTVPANNVTFTAIWQIIQVSITFDVDGGLAITPLVIDYGSTITPIQVPKAIKENARFAGWYMDEELTQPLGFSGYEYKQNTVLYAAYAATAELAKSNFYEQEEALIIAQPTNVTFTVTSATPLTNANLSTYITVTSEKNTVPSLTVANGEEENQYIISPTQLYEEGGEYKISVAEGLLITAQIRDEEVQVYTVVFRIAAPEKNIMVKNANIINVGIGDYYSYTNYLVGLKKQFVFDKAVKKGSILCISDTDGKEEHYKAGEIAYKTVGAQSYYEVQLLACELYDVYEELDVTFNKSATFSDDEIEYLATQNSVQNALLRNADYRAYQGLVASALKDYAVENGIVPLASVKNNKVTFSFKKGEEGSADYAEISISASFKVEFSQKTYAMVTITAVEKVIVDFTGHAKAFVDVFNTEGGSWYDIDLLTILRSETTINLDVILTNNGKTFDIKKDLDNLVNNFNPNSFVEMYKKNLNIGGDQLTVIDLQICRLKIVFEAAEIGVPISFRTKLDINSPFSSKIEVIVEKGYTIKGTQDTELERTMEDRVTYYSLDFGSVGFLSVEAGIAVGIELSFVNLSSAGVVGLEVDVGGYLDYYGYGRQKVSALYLFGIGEPSTEGNAIFYYVFGIYLRVNAYVRSDLFSFDKTVGLHTAKIPLFDGGTKNVVLGFDYDGKDKGIITSSPEMNLKAAGYLNIITLELETGKTSTIAAPAKDIEVLALANGQAGVTYDEDTSKLSVRSYYVENNYRVDNTIRISYTGKHGDPSSYYIYNYIDYTYLPPELDIPLKDLDKEYDVVFKINGDTIATRREKIGSYIRSLDKILEEAQEYDETISCVFWSKEIMKPVMSDLVFEASDVFYIQGQITFEFMVKGGVNSVGYRKHTFRENVGTKITDIIAKLEDFEEVVGGVYRFTGWDCDVSATLPPLSYYEGGKDLYYTAAYEKIPFDYTIILGPRYDLNNNLIEKQRVITHTYTYGDVMNYAEDDEMQRLGYNLDLVGDNDVSYNGFQVAYYGPVVINGTYTLRNDLTVTVYADCTETEIVYRQNNVNYGADLSGILANTEVITEFIESFKTTTYTTDKGLRYCRDFIGWSNVAMLDSVTCDVRIYALSETRYLGAFSHKIRFDAMGGTFPPAMENSAKNGMDLIPNDSLDEEFLQTLQPTFKSNDPQDVGYEYVFAGWYDNADFTGEPYTTIKADADKVMYAKYVKQNKNYSVKLLANGYWQRVQQNGETYVTASDPISGQFAVDVTEYEIQNLTYSSANALVDAVCNGTVDATAYPNFDKTPVAIDNNSAIDDTYAFAYWQVNVFDNYQELVPIYAKSNTLISLNYHFGQGVYDQKHVYGIELTQEDSIQLDFDKLFTPPYLEDNGSIYNQDTGSWNSILFCYEDENYFYIPKSPMCWSRTKNGEPIPEAEYTMVFNGDDEIRSYDFYALYDAVPKTRTIQFLREFSSDELESWSNPEQTSWSISVIGSYGDTLTENNIPIALKGISSNEIPYEYEFSHWVSMSFDPEHPESYDHLIESNLTYTTEDLLDLESIFDAILKAVFVKKTRYVTVTFDADENGYFASNNSRYRTIEVPACVDVYFGETPIYNEGEGYYDYVFDDWSYAEPFSFQTDETVTARSRQVRNETSAPNTGITVSWLNFSGDIGSAHTEIPGFFYYPDLGYIDVYGTGLTFTGTAEDITFNIGSGDVTLEDLTLTVNDREAIYMIPAYENNMSGLNRETNIPININIKGTVTLNCAYKTVIGSSGNYEIHLNGIGQAAKLIINHNSQNAEDQAIELTHLGDYLFITNLCMELNAKIHQTSTFRAFYFQHIYLTMTNSSITVDVEGSVLSENNTYDNAYAFFIDPTYSDGVFLPEDFLNYLTVTGCEKSFIDQPDLEASIPLPAWGNDLE